MKEKLKPKELNKIKQKVESCDSIRYLVGQALFEEDAIGDIKLLIAEIERCWKEIESLHENVKLLTRKALEATRNRNS